MYLVPPVFTRCSSSAASVVYKRPGLTSANTAATNQSIHFVATKRYVRAVATQEAAKGHSYGVYLLAEKRAQ